MSKRPIPMPKKDEELESFINDTNATKQVHKEEVNLHFKSVKKSLVLKETIDDALRLESAKTKIKQITIMETAIAEYLRNRGYENI